MKLKSTLKSYFIVLISIAFIVSILLISFYNTYNRKTTADLVEHTLQVISNSDELQLDIVNHETGVRGYLITENEAFLEPYYSSLINIKIHFNELYKLSSDNLEQQKRLNILNTLINKRIALSSSVIIQIRQHKLTVEGEISEAEQAKIIVDNIRILFKEINKTEYDLLEIRRLANEVSNRNTNLLL